jgi:hypothetical protein
MLCVSFFLSFQHTPGGRDWQARGPGLTIAQLKIQCATGEAGRAAIAEAECIHAEAQRQAQQHGLHPLMLAEVMRAEISAQGHASTTERICVVGGYPRRHR